MVKMRLFASLLSLVLFLFMAHPCVGSSDREMIVVFKGGQTEVPFQEDNGRITKRKPRAFRVPAFVGGIFNGKEFLVLLCDARYNGFSDWSFIEPAFKTSYGDYTTWSAAEILAKNTRKNTRNSVVGDITAVMKGDKIYVLAPSWDKSNTSWVNHKSDTGWDPLMIVGTVMNRTDSEGGGVYVQWENKRSLKDLLPRTVLGAPGFQFIGGVGNGVVTKSGTIIFPIQIANNRRQYASSIMYSTDDGSTWKMGGTTGSGPSECSVTELGDGKLLLSSRYESGFRLVYESDDMGATWKVSTMFSRVWGNQQNRKGVGSQGSLITVPVDGKDVLLFAHPLNKIGGYKRDTLQLWMSDGQRIKCVGTISEDGKGERSGYSILAHVGEHLYSMHEINPFGEWNNYHAALKKWDRVIALSPLPDLFDSVKSTVRAWRHVDKDLNDKGVPTNGLVGFLANSNSNSVWEDKYNSVNGTVHGATRVEGGFHFGDTQGSGAQWPVQSQGQNQFYIFTEDQFTLAATVTIHSTKEAGDHLLLGASKDAAGAKVLIGFGYTQDKKWHVVDTNGVEMATGGLFELGKEYHVAITLNREVSVYVDGVSIIKGGKMNYRSSPISHFFMGGIGKSSAAKGSSCTVKNVMLFNRDLIQTEVDGIKNVDNVVKQTEPVVTTELTVAVEDSKSMSTTEPTGAVEDSQSTSTTEPTGAVEDSKSMSTTEPTGAVEDSKSMSTTEPTVAVEDSQSTSTTEPRSAVEDSQSTSTTEPTGAVEDSKSMSTTEPTVAVEDSQSTSTTEPRSAVEDSQSTSTTEPTVAVEDSKSMSTTEPTGAVEDSKSMSTTEPTVAVEDSQSTSTTEPRSAVEDSQSTSTTEPTGAVEDSKSMSTTEPTVAVEDSQSTSTTEPTAAVEDSQSTSTTEPTVAVEDSQSTSTTEPRSAVEDSQSTSTTEPTAAVEDSQSTSTTEPTVAVEDSQSTSTTEPRAAVEDSQSTSTTEKQETKAVDRHSIPNKDGDYKSEKSEFVTGTSTTENPSEENIRFDGTVGLISFTAWICLVNSAILLAGL